MDNIMNKDRMLQRFLKYVQCDSVSGTEKNFCLMLEEELTHMGYAFVRDEEAGKKAGTDGWNLYVKVEGENPTLDPIMFCAHLDTVSPGVGIVPVVENGVVKSSGDTILGADDKSGIALLMELLQSLKEQGKKPARTVELFFTVCEETGLFGSANADVSHFVSKMALALDYTGDLGNITYRSASILRLYFTITGKPSHAALDPQSGINALKCAVEAISKIPVGNVDDISVINVAELSCPGAPNIVPETASFSIEIRSFTSQQTDAHQKFCETAVKEACEKYGASFTCRVVRVIEPAYVPEDTTLITHLCSCMDSLNITPQLLTIFGGSDATHLFNHGIDACCISTGMDGAHSLSEYLPIDQWNICADLIWKLCQ